MLPSHSPRPWPARAGLPRVDTARALAALTLLAAALASPPAGADTRTLCTIVADAASGRVLAERGEGCATRVTPASTFKIALSLMGFDAGVLTDAHAPVLPFRAGYPDWGGDAWRQPTDPARWMRYSVFWYSQQLTQRLGQARFASYTQRFGYGNADVAPGPGEFAGMKGAWNSGSLRIAPREQIAFLRAIVNRTLPVSAHAFEMTDRITLIDAQPDGWIVHGKTDTSSPGDDGRFDRARAYGWFVGWAARGTRAVVFAHLIQDDAPHDVSAGLRARDALLAELPALALPAAGAVPPAR
ncbi:Beta-lactamase OXA-18 [Burkholderia glumae]|uniref:class D beta-lactamase n=1 Tax=Burkholderia glumae TaxID=337 RepID=UPI0013742396|nr:class D beta-lactamase [Burkholderia glumae]QHP94092.1 class D beta-lactamase [Burkholderia glumae]QKM49554.1 Beta-lactamase OXA-18 [Burkholderia glumae]